MSFLSRLGIGRYKQTYEMVERGRSGSFFYQLFSNKHSGYKGLEEKIHDVLNNPACLLVFKLNCDLFSLVKVHSYKDEKINESNFLYSHKKQPNPFQTWKQFFWDYNFWLDIGGAYLWTPSNVLDENNHIYWLNPKGFDFTSRQLKMLSSFVLSKKTENEINKELIRYINEDGSNTYIPFREIKPFFSLSNGITGNWFTGDSALDALHKVIKNNELTLDAQSSNLDFAGKFVLSGKEDGSKMNDFRTMGDSEKTNIISQLTGGQRVQVTKVPISIDRFVSDLNKLKLDESFLQQYFIIGKMFGVPKDVLESYLQGGGTFENQEKATGKHISYALQPAIDDFTDFLESKFGFEDLRGDWNHLLFNQVFLKDKAETQSLQLDNIQKAKEMGAFTDEEAKEEIKRIMQ